MESLPCVALIRTSQFPCCAAESNKTGIDPEASGNGSVIVLVDNDLPLTRNSICACGRSGLVRSGYTTKKTDRFSLRFKAGPINGTTCLPW